MRKSRIAIALIMGISLSVGSFATAGQAKAEDCKQVRAEDISFGVPPPACASPVGFCTAGTIDGNRGLRGNTSFTALTSFPVAGGPSSPILFFSGTVVITTDKGTLNLSDIGLFDTAGGTLSSIESVTSGTGRFAGARGVLFLATRVAPDGSFVSDVTGELCLQPR